MVDIISIVKFARTGKLNGYIDVRLFSIYNIYAATRFDDNDDSWFV